jgi:membrane-bound metal-dependent hydrolase YbcI (DUF457 family)
MYAVGHLALGYITGKAASEVLDVKVNVPLLLLLSVLPDIDFVMPWLQHRGPTHSLVLSALLFLPIFWLYGKQVVPLFVSLIQHSLLGDLVTGGGVQMLWPIVSKWYRTQIHTTSILDISLEWALFLISMALLWKTRDIISLFQHHPTNLILMVPIVSIILPAFLRFPLAVPSELIIPHLVFLILLVFSIMVDLRKFTRSKH